MPEMIDKQSVLEIAMSYCPDDDGCCSKAGRDIREMLDEIEALSTIEAEPVRHGRWINDTFCSECERFPVDVSVSISNRELTKYFSRCPHCGARMGATDTNVGGKDAN